MKKPENRSGFDTLCQHAGYDPSEHRGHLSEPIYESVAVKHPDAKTAARRFAGEEDGLTYGRAGNDSASSFENRMAALEGGEAALSFASGMAAIRCLTLKLIGRGENLISQRRLYGGTGVFFEREMPDFGREVRFVESRSINPAEWISRINDKTRALYVEMPANPTCDLADIELLACVARSNNIPLVVDSTFATPALLKPLKYGARFVVHSATKYLSCGGVNLAGVIVGPAEFLKQLRLNEYLSYGAPLSPFEAKLCLLGISTLGLRLKRHSESAYKIAAWFRERKSHVKRIFYPGFSDSPAQNMLAKNYLPFGGGGVLSVEFNWDEAACERFVGSLKIFSIAVNLGDSKSLVIHPASTTHSKIGKENLKKAGLSASLVRFSVGLEDADDLISDLKQAIIAAP